MIDNLPGYVSVTFILTTFATVGFLLNAVKRSGADTFPGKLLAFLLAFWLIFQAILAIGGVYQVTDVLPPRLILFGVLPAIVLIIVYFIAFRGKFIENLPLRTLTMLNVVRIPVEIVLLWLFQSALVPQAMTFEGWNYDILTGITAPLIAWLAFRGDTVNTRLLAVWNIMGLLLLAVIVTTAILAFPSPMQQIALDQPNRGVTYFPFVWLPTIVVPIALFSHLASLWKIFRGSLR